MNEKVSSNLNCTQCGGELHPDEGQMFLTCPYCNSTVYLDKSRVVFHWYLAPTLDEQRARSSLARWMASNQTVKDLDKKSRLVGQSFQYFPVWFFKRRQRDGKEDVLLEPAAATSVSEIKHVQLPAGDLRKYDDALEGQSQQPTVPLQAALTWLRQRQVAPDEIAENALVHVPLYTFKYAYDDEKYTAVVEAATGRVLANIYPAKAEGPYQFVGGLSAIVFLGLALVPVLGAIIKEGEGLGWGLAVCGGLGIPAALVLFGLAAWVASKI
jgi:hypothetical protein